MSPADAVDGEKWVQVRCPDCGRGGPEVQADVAVRVRAICRRCNRKYVKEIDPVAAAG